MCTYKTDLEYLSDGIAVVVAAADYYSKTSGKEKLRIIDYRHKDANSAKREAELKYRKAESKFNVRLQMTLRAGVFFPKMERLVKRLGLSQFERLVILTLSKCFSRFTPWSKPCAFSSFFLTFSNFVISRKCPESKNAQFIEAVVVFEFYAYPNDYQYPMRRRS